MNRRGIRIPTPHRRAFLEGIFFSVCTRGYKDA
jgi:hypothetical protein